MAEFTPDFERVLRVCARKPPIDRPPLMELWVDPAFKANCLGHTPEGADDEIAFSMMMHMDYVTYHLNWGRAFARLEKGDGGSAYAFGRECAFETLSDVCNFPFPNAAEYDLEPYYAIKERLPKGMKLIATGGYIFAEAWMLMGFENFAEATLLEPDIPAAIMNKLGEFRYESFLRLIDDNALGAIWYDDDIAYGTGTMVRPDFLRENLFPWMAKIGGLCKARSIPFIYHSDGNLRDVIPDIIKCGVNALHPIEPGAMDIFELREKWGGSLGFIGNMDLDLLARCSFEEIEKLVSDRLPRLKAYGYGYGTSNTIPKWMPVENYLHFRDLCELHGGV